MSGTVEAVRERPILFSGPMVRAILDGRKTQTRRVVTDHTSEGNFKASELRLDDAWVDGSKLKAYLDPAVAKRLGHAPDDIIERLYCRWWPDDLLWVRERHAVLDMRPECLEYDSAPAPRRRCLVSVTYAADDVSVELFCPRESWRRSFDNDCVIWRPSIHMPRWASRLTLRVTDVRVERVQDISEDDAIAEGRFDEKEHDGLLPSRIFAEFWDLLNAKRGYGWDANPYVWVISFERVATQPGGAA